MGAVVNSSSQISPSITCTHPLQCITLQTLTARIPRMPNAMAPLISRRHGVKGARAYNRVATLNWHQKVSRDHCFCSMHDSCTDYFYVYATGYAVRPSPMSEADELLSQFADVRTKLMEQPKKDNRTAPNSLERLICWMAGGRRRMNTLKKEMSEEGLAKLHTIFENQGRKDLLALLHS